MLDVVKNMDYKVACHPTIPSWQQTSGPKRPVPRAPQLEGYPEVAEDVVPLSVSLPR